MLKINFVTNFYVRYYKVKMYSCYNTRINNVNKDYYRAPLHGHVEATLDKKHLFGNFIVQEYSFIFGLFKNVCIDCVEPENQRVFLNDKVPKKVIFSESRVYMAMKGCIFMLRVGAQKSIETFLRNPKIVRYSKVVFFVQKVFFKIKAPRFFY